MTRAAIARIIPAMTSLSAVRNWGEMIKFSHSVFALPFALVATFLAGRNLPRGHPSLLQFVLILICMVAARSFAMTFNRIADDLIDARNPRTSCRAIPAGRIMRVEAWKFLHGASILFSAACAGFLFANDNIWPLLLSTPTLAVLASYSYAKRFTSLAHYILGAVIAFAPTAAWIAIHPNTLGRPALLLTGCVFFWIAGFDIIYACQDVDIDRREGLFSIPAKIGIARALMLSRASHVVSVIMLVGLGVVAALGWLYWYALGVTVLLLVWEHRAVRPHDLTRVNLAFFTLNGIISVLFGIATISDVIWISRR